MGKRKGIYVFFFIILTVLSLFLRLYRIENRLDWYSDNARDMLFARHAMNVQERILVGHPIYYIQDFYYPPYYFYGLGLLTSAIKNPFHVMTAVVIGESLLPILVGLLAAISFSYPVGIFAALCIAISAYAVSITNVWPAYIAPVLFYLGTLLFHIGGHGKRVSIMLLSLFLMMCGGILSIPVMVCTLIFTVLHVPRLPTHMSIRLFLFICFLWFCLQIPLFISLGFWNVMDKYIPHGPGIPVGLYAYGISFPHMWMSFFDNNGIMALFALLVLVVCCMLRYRTVLSFIKTRPDFILICFLLPLLGSFGVSQIPGTYEYVVLFPIVILFFSVVLFYGWERDSWIRRGVCIFAAAVLLLALANRFQQSLDNTNALYPKTRDVTAFIHADAQTRHIQDTYTVIAGGGNQQYSYESMMYWFFQEELYHTPVIRLIDGGKDFRMTITDPRNIYLICRIYFDRTEEQCIQPFEQDHKSFNKKEELHHLFGAMYRIFLYSQVSGSTKDMRGDTDEVK